MFGLAQGFQSASVVIRRTGGRGHWSSRHGRDDRGDGGGQDGRGLWMLGLAQGFQSASVVGRTGGGGHRRGRDRRSGFLVFFGRLFFRFRRLPDRLGLFGLAEGLKCSGLIVWTCRGGLTLACRRDADSDTTRHDGEFSVSHACFLEQAGKEINCNSLPNCAFHARAKG
jgi:hypothetical protein